MWASGSDNSPRKSIHAYYLNHSSDRLSLMELGLRRGDWRSDATRKAINRKPQPRQSNTLKTNLSRWPTNNRYQGRLHLCRGRCKPFLSSREEFNINRPPRVGITVDDVDRLQEEFTGKFSFSVCYRNSDTCRKFSPKTCETGFANSRSRFRRILRNELRETHFANSPTSTKKPLHQNPLRETFEPETNRDAL